MAAAWVDCVRSTNSLLQALGGRRAAVAQNGLLAFAGRRGVSGVVVLRATMEVSTGDNQLVRLRYRGSNEPFLQFPVAAGDRQEIIDEIRGEIALLRDEQPGGV